MPEPQTRTHTRPPHSVTVSHDGKIVVKPGDWLSKYSWAIYGNYTTLHEFERWNAQNDTSYEIQNKDLIKAGEILVYLPVYKEYHCCPEHGF